MGEFSLELPTAFQLSFLDKFTSIIQPDCLEKYAEIPEQTLLNYRTKMKEKLWLLEVLGLELELDCSKLRITALENVEIYTR